MMKKSSLSGYGFLHFLELFIPQLRNLSFLPVLQSKPFTWRFGLTQNWCYTAEFLQINSFTILLFFIGIMNWEWREQERWKHLFVCALIVIYQWTINLTFRNVFILTILSWNTLKFKVRYRYENSVRRQTTFCRHNNNWKLWKIILIFRVHF